jgi:hypothetical protein
LSFPVREFLTAYTGAHNVAIGYASGAITTGAYNVAIGNDAWGITTGDHNVAVGYHHEL